MKHVADYEDGDVKNSRKIDFPRPWWFNMDDGIMDIKATWSSESWNRSFRLHTWAQSNAPRHRVHSMDLMSEHCPRHTVYVIIHDHLMEQTMWTTRRAGQPFLALTWWTPHIPHIQPMLSPLLNSAFFQLFRIGCNGRIFGNWKVEACHVRISHKVWEIPVI